MKFAITLLLGVVLGAGGLFLYQQAGETPAAREIERQVNEISTRVVDEASETASDVQATVAPKLAALQLRAADLREELEGSGRIVRRRAQELQASAVSAAADAKATLVINGKLAADPELSALAVDVNTTNGHVTLSGAAPSLGAIGRAILLAMETDGVEQVTSTLQVR